MSDKLFGPDSLGLSPGEVVRRVLLSGALERATWHPLGFVHTQLESNDEYSVRLHIWPPGTRKAKSPDWQVHNHVFALTSRVLVGSVLNKTYDILDVDQRGAAKQLYEFKYSDAGSELLPMQRYVSVSCASTHRYEVGDIYNVPRGVFHESIVEGSQLVATLVKTDFSVAVAPLVLGELDLQGRRRYEYRRLPVDQADLRGWFEKVASEMQQRS
jgi:hypothetical protein